MKIAVNDLSFQYTLYDYATAKRRLDLFIDMCRRIESGEMKLVEGIVSDYIDKTFEISPGCSLFHLVQSMADPDRKRYLLGLLVNRGFCIHENEEKFSLDGKNSVLCAWARKYAVVSLCSSLLFSKDRIVGKIGECDYEIRNLSQPEHIDKYRFELGIRKYKGNDKKHKKDRENPYGRGKIGSRMDLDDQEAQELLNKAIVIKGRLYGRMHGKNYAFQREQDVYYHGYVAEDLGDDIQTELNKYRWNS